MNWLRQIVSRLRAVLGKRQRDRVLDEELQTHLALLVEQNIERGMSPEAARREAKLSLGGADQIKESVRDHRGLPFLETIVQDLRFGLRMLRKSPGFTAVAVLTLALGIGANTAIFSLIDSIFLQMLPVKNAAQVVDVYKTVNGSGYGELSYPDYVYYRDHAQSFSELAAQYPTSPINLVISRDAEQVNGSVVTSNYFGLLDLTPALGRFFFPEEDQTPGKSPVAVISYSYWQRRFGGNAQVVGKEVQANGTAFTIVGVAPQGFQGAVFGVDATDMWIPTAMFHVGYHYCDAFQRDCTVISLLGRLKNGRTLADAEAEMSVLAKQLEAAYP